MQLQSNNFFKLFCYFFILKSRNLFFFAGSVRTSAPRISHENLVNVSVTLNGTATFKCVQEKLVASLGQLQFDWIKWTKDESVHSTLDIDHGNFIAINTSSKSTIKESNEHDKVVSYLTIHNVILDDTGLYSCVVCNQHGRDFSSAVLSLSKTPSPG